MRVETLDKDFQQLFPGRTVYLDGNKTVGVTVYPCSIPGLVTLVLIMAGSVEKLRPTVEMLEVDNNAELTPESVARALKALAATMTSELLPLVSDHCDRPIEGLPHFVQSMLIEAWLQENFADDKINPTLRALEAVWTRLTGARMDLLGTLSRRQSRRATQDKTSLNTSSPVSHTSVGHTDSFATTQEPLSV